ncbi:MAG: OmpH family outer membrane protein [Bacteroidales bacterium]
MRMLLLLVLLVGFQVGFGQKIGYIEVDQILLKMDSFKIAGDQINESVKLWETEIEARFQQVEDLYQDYVMNESQMNDQQKKEKQNQIFQAERQANEFKESKFGQQGELMQIQEEKLKPIYDSIFETTEKVAQKKGMDYVFEKTAESTWIYTNPSLNLTEEVIEALGIK